MLVTNPVRPVLTVVEPSSQSTEDLYSAIVENNALREAYEAELAEYQSESADYNTELSQQSDKLRKAQNIIRYADYKLNTPERFHQLHHILTDLEKSMSEPYRFSVYAADGLGRSVNFGLVATYRQKWELQNYQVGELLKTIPLAPKEVRKFTRKLSIRKSRAEKEVENNLQVRKSEAAQTARAETEIIQKAHKKANFQLGAEGSASFFGLIGGKASAAFAGEAATDSQETKKEFREAVFKASEEYKSERTTEINVSTGEETSFEESGEISNPNDEIPVTYLFYELQRRYKISEHIHALTPVILVAQEFPKPDEIDEDWIIANDWILRRVILDDSFVPALTYLASNVIGDEFALEEMYRNIRQQRRIIDQIKEELVEMREESGNRYAALERSISARAKGIQQEDEGGGIIPTPIGFIFGGSDAPSPEAMQVREDAARDALERAARQEKEMQGRLERETTALNSLTETYTKKLSDHLNRKTQIIRLRVHIKSNIMYYMQAIWNHEPPDQRFFRLHEVRVPNLQAKVTYTIQDDPDLVPEPPNWTQPQKVVANCEIDSQNIGYKSLTRRASDQARCIVRAGGLREIDAGGPRLVRKFRLVVHATPSAFGKEWCPVGAAERHPARNAGLSRQSGWCSPVMEGNKCPTRHRHDSAKKRRGTPA